MKNLNLVMNGWMGRFVVFAAMLIGTLNALPSVALSDAELLERMDASELVLPTTNTIPASVLAYDPATSLGQEGGEISQLIGEPIGSAIPVPNGSAFSSANFDYLVHPGPWRFLLMVGEQGVPSPVAPQTALRQDTRAKLESLGIFGDEIGTVEHRRLMAQEMDEQGVLGQPEGIAHKFFVQRAIGGIELLDSHVVTTYTPTRGFKKMLGRWPGIAESGHVLNTTISVDDAKELVLARLVEAGETDPVSDILLDSVYDAVPGPDGRIALDLKIRATVLTESPDEPVGDEGLGEKARVYLVSPVPEPGFAGALAVGGVALATVRRRLSRLLLEGGGAA